jgi:hypothetical protein
MPTTIRSEGENQLFFELAFFTRPRIISSAALKSAITPLRSGRTVRMLSGSLPSMSWASLPTAISLSVRRSSATIEGSSMTILSLCMMIVLAVPRSIAISLVRLNNLILSVYQSMLGVIK